MDGILLPYIVEVVTVGSRSEGVTLRKLSALDSPVLVQWSPRVSEGMYALVRTAGGAVTPRGHPLLQIDSLITTATWLEVRVPPPLCRERRVNTGSRCVGQRSTFIRR